MKTPRKFPKYGSQRGFQKMLLQTEPEKTTNSSDFVPVPKQEQMEIPFEQAILKECSQLCSQNVVCSTPAFMGFSTITTKTTFYKKKYIKDNNRDIRVYKENFKLFGTIVVVVCSLVL